MDCMCCMGLHRSTIKATWLVVLLFRCVKRVLSPLLYCLLSANAFWYSLLLWNQPEIFLEHFDTTLLSRCLVYISVYTMMYVAHTVDTARSDRTKCDNYLSYLTVEKYCLCSVFSIITCNAFFGFALICFAFCVCFYGFLGEFLPQTEFLYTVPTVFHLRISAALRWQHEKQLLYVRQLKQFRLFSM